MIRAIDGPLFITSCITIHGACDLAGTCTIKEPLRKVNDSIKDLLSGIRIADLVEAGRGRACWRGTGGWWLGEHRAVEFRAEILQAQTRTFENNQRVRWATI